MRICCVYRDERYSPNSVEKDRAILEEVGLRLREAGHAVRFLTESEVVANPSLLIHYDMCFSMARSAAVLRAIKACGVRCVNGSDGVALCCHRAALDTLMRHEQIAMPPIEGENGYWLKRGDGPAEQTSDIVFCQNEQALTRAKEAMSERGISEQVVSSHVVGDLLKFYGVRAMDFFRYYYPSDDGITKFGNETVNGQACHYAFDARKLADEAERLAGLVNVDVYGGDCVVRSDGSIAIIDFNDWPSFSRCRSEAAAAIARLADRE